MWRLTRGGEEAEQIAWTPGRRELGHKIERNLSYSIPHFTSPRRRSPRSRCILAFRSRSKKFPASMRLANTFREYFAARAGNDEGKIIREVLA